MYTYVTSVPNVGTSVCKFLYSDGHFSCFFIFLFGLYYLTQNIQNSTEVAYVPCTRREKVMAMWWEVQDGCHTRTVHIRNSYLPAWRKEKFFVLIWDKLHICKVIK
jgi:hypothetical protein